MPFKVIYSLSSFDRIDNDGQQRVKRRNQQQQQRYNDVEMKAPLNYDHWPMEGVCPRALDVVNNAFKMLLNCLKTGARIRILLSLNFKYDMRQQFFSMLCSFY